MAAHRNMTFRPHKRQVSLIKLVSEVLKCVEFAQTIDKRINQQVSTFYTYYHCSSAGFEKELYEDLFLARISSLYSPPCSSLYSLRCSFLF